MRAPKPIKIVGAGISGLSLGLALRQHDVPVTVIEAGKLPRHRVCGEFISGRGLHVLDRLGMTAILVAHGARQIQTVQFHSGTLSRELPLPEPALCCSRFVFDHLLAQEFCAAGGNLIEQQRWHGDERAEGFVLATGRRIHRHRNRWRWLGLKAHARQVASGVGLQIHLLENGYVGLCDVAPGTTNVCGLIRSRTPWTNLAEHWEDELRGPVGTELHRAMAHAEFDPSSFCAVAGLGFRPDAAAMNGGCRLGDAYGVIAPIAGNGMSIGLESAALALQPLLSYSRGELPWASTLDEIHKRSRRAFQSRLRLAWMIQEWLFLPLFRRCLILFFWRCPRTIQLLIRQTR